MQAIFQRGLGLGHFLKLS